MKVTMYQVTIFINFFCYTFHQFSVGQPCLCCQFLQMTLTSVRLHWKQTQSREQVHFLFNTGIRGTGLTPQQTYLKGQKQAWHRFFLDLNKTFAFFSYKYVLQLSLKAGGLRVFWKWIHKHFLNEMLYQWYV